MAIIKTPDQRVRVFISSTINELAEERQAARQAIENLRLIPVFLKQELDHTLPETCIQLIWTKAIYFWASIGTVMVGLHLAQISQDWRMNTDCVGIKTQTHLC